MTNNYLGIIISASGRFDKAINALTDKARRTYYSIRRSLNKFNPPIKICLKLFRSIIQPIILYGSEVWGPLLNQKRTSWDTNPTEKLHLEFCRDILKVHRNTPNLACRPELGQSLYPSPWQKGLFNSNSFSSVILIPTSTEHSWVTASALRQTP